MRWSLQFGLALLASGVLWVLHALGMDTEVELPGAAQAQGLAVENLVQLAERHEFLVTGGVFLVIGVVLILLGTLERRVHGGADVWKCPGCGEWITRQVTGCPMCGAANRRAPAQHPRDEGFTRLLSVLTLLLATSGSNALGGVVIGMVHESQSFQFSRTVAELKTQEAVNRIDALLGRGKPVTDCADLAYLVDRLPFGFAIRYQPIGPSEDVLCRVSDQNGQIASLLVHGVSRRGQP